MGLKSWSTDYDSPQCRNVKFESVPGKLAVGGMMVSSVNRRGLPLQLIFQSRYTCSPNHIMAVSPGMWRCMDMGH